jgi:hypothetical protein
MTLKHIGFLVWILLAIIVSSGVKSYGQSAGSWQIEVVDSSGGREAGAFSSLAIDRSGNLHLVYSDRTASALRYAFRAKGDQQWDKTTIDVAGGSFESMAVDSHGWPHVAYNVPKQPGLHYARWNGKQWEKLVIDSAKTNRAISIQLDSHDSPRISYYRELYSDLRSARSLKYAYFDGTTWYVQTVDHRNGAGSWNSLALDREDRPYISYSIASGFLGVASLIQSAWDHSLADFNDPKGKRNIDADNSLTIGPDGEPRVAFVNATERTVEFGWREKDGWHQETVDSLVATGAEADRVSLKLDRKGDPRIVYYDSGLGALKYAIRDKAGWHTETIDGGNAGQYASLSLNENDEPYVSYYTTSAMELHLAHRRSADASAKQ